MMASVSVKRARDARGTRLVGIGLVNRLTQEALDYWWND